MSKNQKLFTVVSALFLVLALCAMNVGPGIEANDPLKSEMAEASTNAPKYVFYFIGDGLGASQRQSAEFFLQVKSGNDAAKLLMNTFPVAGINTTYSNDTLVTDSAAAGTALATGYKTNNGMIAVLPNGKAVRSLIQAAEEQGKATGIITNTRLTHATPAVFAANNNSRNNENEIAQDYLDSGVDFFAGGGYRHFVPQDWELGKSKREDSVNVAQEFSDNGYHVFLGDSGCKDFKNYSPADREKVFAAFTNSHMPYELDRINSGSNVPSLADITEKGIKVLSKYDQGFFMMVEAGRIDHACHANDPAGSIHDTLAFDEAVKEAYEFYRKHPGETLIVVVGDHETGGMGLGFAKNYFLSMDELLDVKFSVEDTLQGKYTGDRAAYFSFIEKNMGLDNLTNDEKANIEKAMGLLDNNADTGSVYGGYDPVAIATTHVISERANLFWTTYAHSATAIPMSAIGVGADNFGGYKDNTEIAKAMADLMGYNLGYLN